MKGLVDFKPFIYGLVDSLQPGHIRYIGMAARNPNRPYAHTKLARKASNPTSHILRWIKKLHVEGRDYEVIVLEECNESISRKDLGCIESAYISAFKEIGHQLTNETSGGDGLIDPTEEVRKKISDATRKGQSSEATHRKMRESAIKRFQDPEQRRLRSETAKAAYTDEVRKKVGDAQLGRIASEQTKAKMKLSQSKRRLAEALLNLERAELDLEATS